MKYFFFHPLVLVSSIQTYAQQLLSEDSMLIHSIMNDWNRAWNTEDYVLAAKLYSTDTRFTNAEISDTNGKE